MKLIVEKHLAFTITHICLIKSRCVIKRQYSKPCQTSKTERFAKVINDFQPLTIFAKLSVLDN